MSSPVSTPFEDRAFLLLLAATSLLFFWMLHPFFNIIFWAVVIGLLSRPLFVFLRRRGIGASLASLLCVLTSLVVIVVPCVYIFYTCANEISQLYARLRGDAHALSDVVERLREAVPGALELIERFGYTPESLKAKLSEQAVKVSGILASNTVALGSITVNLVMDMAMMLYLAFFLVRDGERFRALLIRALPFGDHREELLFQKFAEVLRATVKGSVLVAVAQGALGGVIFAVLDIRAPVLWGVVMSLLSLIPLVGAGLVWAPVAVYLLLTGEIVSGLALMAYGVCVIGLADNILRPLLVGRDTKLPDFLVLLSTLGGFMMFGMDGFVSGPVLAVFFVTLWQIFMEEFSQGSAGSSGTARLEKGRSS